MNETDANKPQRTNENGVGKNEGAIEGGDRAAAAQPLASPSAQPPLPENDESSDDEDDGQGEITSFKGIEKYVKRRKDNAREAEELNRIGESMVSAAAPMIIKAMAEVPLPPGYAEKVWEIARKYRMLPGQRAACRFVCVHLWDPKTRSAA